MKKITVLVLACICSGMAMAGSGIYIEYKISAGGSGQSINGTIKTWAAADGSSRSEMNMQIPSMPGGMNIVTLHKATEPDKMYTIKDASKTYSVTDMSSMKHKNSSGKETKVDIQVVGNEKVNGYNTVHFKVSYDGKEATDMWTTKEIPGYQNFSGIKTNKYLSDENVWQQMKTKGADGAPVRMRAAEHGSEMQLDLMKAEKADIPADKLQIPSGYKEAPAFVSTMIEAGKAAYYTQEELMKMTPAERERYMQELKEKYQKK